MPIYMSSSKKGTRSRKPSNKVSDIITDTLFVQITNEKPEKDIINTFKGSELLSNDIKRAEEYILKFVPKNISQDEFDALVIQAHNRLI